MTFYLVKNTNAGLYLNVAGQANSIGELGHFYAIFASWHFPKHNT